MWPAIRRYGFTVFCLVFVIVAAFFVNWGEVWFAALWILCSTLVASNLINVIRVVDANETAARYYDKFIEYRRAHAEAMIELRKYLPKKGYQSIPEHVVPRETD